MLTVLALIRTVALIVVALGLAIIVSYIPAPKTAEAPKLAPVTTISTATTTVAVVVASSTPVIVPKLITKPSTTPTPAPPKQKPVAILPKVEDLNITLNQAIQAITNLSSGASTTTISVNDRVRAALVNIICTTDVSGPFESISGSGVIIDPRGVIITNAHIAQFFLLRDYPHKDFVRCVIRTGSPASPKYTAELLFLPPTWIAKNAAKINDESPTGSGEHDYALLRITGGVSSAVQLPPQFPFVLTAISSPLIGTNVLQAGYAAGFLGGISIQTNLFAVSAYAKVMRQYTYGVDTADLFSLGGSIVAQQGSSGGAVTNTDGTLIGVIVTSTTATDTASRDLRALATSYIIRDFETERGKSLAQTLASDLDAEVDIYSKVFAPSARQTLIAELEK